MAESTIQWTDFTWNPHTGCTKVSPGCKFCYMYRDKERYGQDPKTVIRSAPGTFNKPLHLKTPQRIFTCSWSDFFIEEADAWRAECWDIIRRTPQHTYQILTKRPERILECLPPDWGSGYANVWLGVSVENQEMANLRIPQLVAVPAAVRFLSVEPLIGPIDFEAVEWLLFGRNFNGFGHIETGTEAEFYTDDYNYHTRKGAINWVIAGGESGNETGKYLYRPSELQWYLDIIAYCKAGGVPVFMKQTGTHLAKQLQLADRHGGEIAEWPAALQVREWPQQ